jgi:apolipoprotein N-acyltransferase
MSTAFVAAAVRQGADVVVTLSNDAWFAGGRAARLVLAAAAFRSIETRRPQVRATTTGMSAVITPTGELAGALDAGARGALVREVGLVGRPWTPVIAFGDWLGPAALVTALAAVVVLVLRRDTAMRGQGG